MRLIDADALNSWLEGYAREYVLGKQKISITNILAHVRDMPTIQTERKWGRWIGIDDEPCEVYECDVCGAVYDTVGNTWDLPNYCPNCGAKMTEG